MFAIEIDFNDGVSQSEAILVRRPQAVIGSSEYAHVVIDDMRELGIELKVTRERGRRLCVKPLGTAAAVQASGVRENLYENAADINVGNLKLHIQALDSDLLYKDGEPPDRAGVRVMQLAASRGGPEFPAVMMLGPNPMTLSFSPQQTVTIGRANHCLVRIDSPEISSQHAKMGYERGDFWIEDLGSTNGTFVEQQQIGGRTRVAAGVPITLAREIIIVGVDSEERARGLLSVANDKAALSSVPVKKPYPAIVCLSEGARPSRLVISSEATVKIGRDPSSDMWLGVPHVSRLQCTIYRGRDVELVVKDHSTNGTFYDDGILEKGDSLSVNNDPKVLDFGGNITVGICFTEEQEKQFIESRGSPLVFTDPKLLRATRAGRGTRSFSGTSLRLVSNEGSGELLQAPPGGIEKRQSRLEGFIDFFGALDKKAKSLFCVTLVMLFVVVALIVNMLKPVLFGG